MESLIVFLYFAVAGVVFSVSAFLTTKLLNRVFGKRFYAVLDNGKKVYETQQPNETERDAVKRLVDRVSKIKAENT